MQAFAPHQLMRRRLFWSQPPPIGINDVPLEELIDIDEAGFGLGVCNRPQGKSLIGVRIRNPGLYGHFQKFTLILAVGSRVDLFMPISDQWPAPPLKDSLCLYRKCYKD